jgi:hypothetical protein
VDFSSSVALQDFPEYYHDGGPSVDTIFANNTSIRRGVTYSEPSKQDEYKKFTRSDFASGDADLDDDTDLLNDIQSGGTIQIVMYVVSYGYEINPVRVVYSEPVYLQSISKILPP